MDAFPPPAPDSRVPEPTPSESSKRRWIALAAAAAVGIGVGGVAIGSQFASADDAQPSDDGTTDETTDDSQPTEADTADDEQPADTDDDTSDAERVEDHERRLPHIDGFPDIGEIVPELEAVEQCVSEAFPDIFDGTFGDFGGLDDIDDLDDLGTAFDDLVGGTVTVLAPGADEGLSVFDFGDGDGTVTITQTDGEIEVSTEGDVATVEHDAVLEVPEIEPDPEAQGALDECLELLPEGGFLDIITDAFPSSPPDDATSNDGD